MYTRSASIVLLALPLLASAAPFRLGGFLFMGSCAPAGLQCCASSQAASSSNASAIMSLLGINAKTVAGLVGLSCNSITDIDAISTSCTGNRQPLCCSDPNSFKGFVALGCTPIIL